MNGILKKDDYTYRHNIGVSVLASLLAKWLGLSREEISLISMGGLLHDISKLYIPDEIHLGILFHL
ncbi:HD-GYP domain-containing protein [Alkalihalobacillus sp. BA299]|uniref:HD-GYP domain-containing protein n=1 Tax=Alkalihalobacillus sp. BA299 TaxID=2815938 RepID=UPI001ADB7EE5|nr:HD domain-containing protein [Alkalihalobacillus sp. BA299]